MRVAGERALAANEHAARQIRALREDMPKAPPIPVVPAPGTPLYGGLSDGKLNGIQQVGSHMFSTGAGFLDALGFGLFGQGYDALADTIGGDAEPFLDRDSPGYRAVDIASMATAAGALRKVGKEAIEEGGERAVRSGGGLTTGERVGIVRDALQRKGNYGLGSATRGEADEVGRDFVGPGFSRSRRDPTILISSDGLRQYRPPSYKPNLGREQANLERRFEPGGQFNANGHLDIAP